METNYCEAYPALIKYINLCDYSLLDVSLVITGTLFWVVCYIAVIKTAFKHKFIEMPMFVGAGNIAWEFIWSFFFFTNMGVVFLWGYRIWFFLDVVIFYLLFKYGHKQVDGTWLRKNYKYIFTFITIFFCFFFHQFADGGYDTKIGATSAYMLSVGISTLYIGLYLRRSKEYQFSWTAAWTRAVGDTIMSIFVLRYYDIGILWVMAAYVILLDMYYVYLVYKDRKNSKLNNQ